MPAFQRRFPFAHLLNHVLHAILGAAILVVVARPSTAQQITGLREGARVKIEATGAKDVVGVVRSAGADSITLFLDGRGGLFTLANSHVKSIKLSRGRTTGHGALMGGLWGSAVGAALGTLIVASDEKHTYYAESQHKTSEFVSMVLGGALWGAGIGAFTKAEKWDNVALQPRVTASRDGVGLAFAINAPFTR